MSEQTKKYFTGAEVDALLAKSNAEIEARREVVPGPAQGGKVWNPETAPKPYQPASKTAGRVAAGAIIIASLGFFAIFYVFNYVLERQFYLVDLYKIYMGGSNNFFAAAALVVGLFGLVVGIMLMIRPEDAGYFNIIRLDQSIMTYIQCTLLAMICFIPTYWGIVAFSHQTLPMNHNYGAVIQKKIEDETGVKVSIQKALELGNYEGGQNNYRNNSILKANGKEYEISTSFYGLPSPVKIFISEIKDQKTN